MFPFKVSFLTETFMKWNRKHGKQILCEVGRRACNNLQLSPVKKTQISWNIGVKLFHIEEVGDPIFCRTLTFEGNLRCYIYPKVFLKTLGCEPVCLVLKGTNSKLFIQWSNTSTLFKAIMKKLFYNLNSKGFPNFISQAPGNKWPAGRIPPHKNTTNKRRHCTYGAKTMALTFSFTACWIALWIYIHLYITVSICDSLDVVNLHAWV